MNLRSKALLIVTSIWAVIFITAAVDSKLFLEKSFEEQENKLAIKDLNRVRNALNNQMEALALYTVSWAQWDDAYAFMKNKNKQFIKSNFVPGTYTSSSLNFFLFYDTKGKYFYGQTFNLQKEQFEETPNTLLNVLSKEQAFLTHQGNPAKRTGIFSTPEGVIILSSIPVQNSDGTSPSGGSLLMGYYLEGKHIKELAKTVEMNLTFYPLPLKQNDINLASILSKLLSNHPHHLVKHNEQTIYGYTLIRDINNQPVGMLEVDIPRTIYSEGISAINHFQIGLVIIGIAMLLTLWYLLSKLVLNRIVDISSQVVDINKAGSFDKRIKVSGNDELNEMTTSLNSMLEMIEQVQGQLNYRISQRTKDLEKITKLNRNLFTEMGKQKAMEAKLREDKKQLKKMAYSDLLTGLPNRASFQDKLTKALSEASETRKVAVIFLDIDKFKKINDTYGHDFGDKFLKEIAIRLKKAIGDHDIAARLAGDEFILYLGNVTGTKMIDDAVENIFQHITALVNIEGITLTPTFSMGVSICPDDSTSLEKLCHQADIAMYYAKKQEGNIYFYFAAINTRSPSPSTPA